MAFFIEDINRGIYEAIRLVLVEGGHCPDETIDNTPALYRAAQAFLKAAGNILIEVYPVGTGVERPLLRQNCIVIDCETEGIGQVGDGSRSLLNTGTEEEPVWVSVENNPMSTDIDYFVRYITQETTAEAALSRACDTALKSRSVLYPYNAAGEKGTDFFRIFRAGPKLDVSAPGYSEKVFRITVKDVYLSASKIGASLVTMTDLTFKPEPIK